MRCIVCSEDIEAVDEEENEPVMGGTYFITYGGTEIFDPAFGAYLEIFICDSCLLGAAGVGDVMRARVSDKNVIFDIWDGSPDTKRH